MIVLQAVQVLRQLSGGIASRAAAQGPVGGGSSDSPLGFPLFTMQGGPAGHLASRLALTEVIAVASQCHKSRDGDRASDELGCDVLESGLVQKLTFLEILNRCVLNIFYVLFEKKIPK